MFSRSRKPGLPAQPTRVLWVFAWVAGPLLVITNAVAGERPASPAAAKTSGDIELIVDVTTLSGPSVRLDKESKLAVGWSNEKDRAQWSFSLTEAGAYRVMLRWQVENDDANQPFVIEVNNEPALTGQVLTTNGVRAPELRPIGVIDLSAGEHQLVFRPAGSVKKELLQLHSLTLTPAVSGDSSPPPMNVPDGFEIETVAGPPLVRHPMMGCFDDRGRLFIAESAGINRRAAELLETRPHSIVMLEDVDHDGTFDKRTIFADKMVLPNGAHWHNGALYVCSAPFLWRLEDTDGDGRADRRERILGRFGFTGMSDSLHGPVLGPDGRFYFCGGQHGWVLCAPDSNGPYASKVPGVFSCWPDGSQPELLSHGGQANPVEVTFTPEGEVLGTLAILDRFDGRHDALLHWIYGGVHNIRESYLNKVKRTGPLLTAFGRRGHVAPVGNTRYRGTQFGSAYHGNLFLCEFNTHNVFRVMLQRDGATFRAREEVFLSSPDEDVHFTDVIEDADGSLLVFNTGGWFRYGCPTSQVAKSHILGGIYRIRRTDGSTLDDPRGLSIPWAVKSNDELSRLLDDPRFVVRDRAIAELARRGEAALPALSSAVGNSSVRTRRNAIWALTRIDDVQARQTVRTLLDDPEPGVRLAAVHSVSVRRDADAVSQLTGLLADEMPAVRREAATALGRIGNTQVIPALLAALREPHDRFHEHSLIYALIELNDRPGTLAGLDEPNPEVRRAALIALDQMDDGNLTREQVARLLDTDDEPLQLTLLEIIGRHAGWSDEINGLVARWLSEQRLSPERQASLRGALIAFSADRKIQTLVAGTLAKPTTPVATKLLLLEAIARSHLKQLPKAWSTQLRTHLNAHDPRVLQQTIVAVSAFDDPQFDPPLTQLARSASQPVELQVAAAAIVATRSNPLPGDLFDLLAGQCDSEAEPVVRLKAAGTLGTARLTRVQRQRVIDLIAQAGPLQLPGLISQFETAANPDEGLSLVAALEKSPGVESLPAARLVKLLEAYPPAVRSAADDLLNRLNVDAAQQADELARLEAELSPGNATHGRAVYLGKRASCSACHRIGDQGGNVGPVLSQIGKIRTRRDLLEAIAFPSMSFARGFEPMNVLTTSGKVHSGVIGRETADAIHLRTADRAEVRVPREEIEELQPAKVSIMPKGLAGQLRPEELSDLLAYLKSLE